MAQDKDQPRFFFIELIAYWEGQINATTLSNQFSISRQLATKLIAEYMKLAPSNLIYTSSQKTFLVQQFNSSTVQQKIH